ncbi:MAG: (2Fe-2S) ferredoxin domain-containing protein [Bacteroidota bacterium]
MADKKLHILVCNSARPKLSGGGCCNDKGSEDLLLYLHTYLEEANLHKKVIVKGSACLSNCRTGISMKMLPDNVLYGKVTPEDIPEIIHSHLQLNQPVDRLVMKSSNDYWWM